MLSPLMSLLVPTYLGGVMVGSAYQLTSISNYTVAAKVAIVLLWPIFLAIILLRGLADALDSLPGNPNGY